MAQVNERLTLSRFQKDLSALAGLKVSRVWLGVADALFLECGRLKRVKLLRPRRDRTKTTLEGQVTFMLDCEWRVENRHTVDYGSVSSSRVLARRTEQMVGTHIVSVEAVGSVPELAITLQCGQIIRTFMSYEGPPRWSVGFNDLTLLDLEPEWAANDVSVWLGFENKSYQRFHCLDPTTFKPKKFLKKYGL